MWIFGYGSLMQGGWETTRGCLRRVVAELPGYRRVFNKASVRNWGTKKGPCPTLNLVKGEHASCWGIAFEFPDDRKDKVLAYLAAREGKDFSLCQLSVQIEGNDEVIAFVPLYKGLNIIDGLTLAETVVMVRAAQGIDGSCVKYVKDVSATLADVSINDPVVTELAHALGCQEYPMRMDKIPNFEWCAEKSKAKGITIRCPFATVESCPRYYQSLSLLGMAGSTTIPKDEDERLRARWKASDLWPRTAEYETSISGWEGKPSQFSNFCPEVAFDRFRYFATYLGRYADEIDMDAAHNQLAQENAPQNDPRWSWASISPQHYTECSIYAVLMHRTETKGQLDIKPELPWWRRHLIEIIVGVVITVIGGLLLKVFGE